MDKERLEWHLSIPVCRIMSGARQHLSIIDFNELRLLCQHFNCSCENVAEKFWLEIQKRRGKAK